MKYIWVLLAALLAAGYLFVIAKVLGYRQITQLSVFDYINGITIGSIAANLVTEPERWVEYLLALTVFGGVTWFCSFLSDHSIRFRRFATGEPIILLENGKLYDKSFAKAKIDLDEFLTMCRTAGYFDPNEIDTAVLEFNGILSIFPKTEYRPVTLNDLGRTAQKGEIPAVVIQDGNIMRGNLKTTGKEENWLREALATQNYSHIKDIFLATLTVSGTLTVYPRAGVCKKDLYL